MTTSIPDAHLYARASLFRVLDRSYRATQKAFDTVKDAPSGDSDRNRRYDAMNQLNDARGEAAQMMFELPARTVEGVLEKLKIAYQANGDGPGTDSGEVALSAFQDLEDPWMAGIIRDLERLVGEGRL